MTPNVYICTNETELEANFSEDFIAHIDGKEAMTLRNFYEAVADLLEIPDFAFTLEALNDALNDLQWLDEERIVFYFTNTTDLINKERDPAKIANVLNVMDATAEDWKWVQEDEEAERKEIILVFENSSRICKILDSEHIDYLPLSTLNSDA